jgi:hypothetical protein
MKTRLVLKLLIFAVQVHNFPVQDLVFSKDM